VGATGTVGKKELAAALEWSRPTLDKRLKTDPKFPVVRRGDQSGGWAFSIEQVRSYLAGGKPKAIDPAQLRDVVKAPLPEKPTRRSAHHEGEATARQRKDDADAGLREIKLAQLRGEVIDREEIRQVFSEAFAQLGNDLDALPESIVKRHDLPDAAIPDIRKQVDDARTAMVRNLLEFLADQPAA